MGVQVYWHDEDQRILVYSVTSPWNLEDLYDGLEQGGKLGEETSPEYIIYDVTASDSLPQGFFSSLRLMQQAYLNTINLRVLVGAQGVVKSVFGVIKRIAPNLTRTIVLAPTMETAVALIGTHQSEDSAAD